MVHLYKALFLKSVITFVHNNDFNFDIFINVIVICLSQFQPTYLSSFMNINFYLLKTANYACCSLFRSIGVFFDVEIPAWRVSKKWWSLSFFLRFGSVPIFSLKHNSIVRVHSIFHRHWYWDIVDYICSSICTMVNLGRGFYLSPISLHIKNNDFWLNFPRQVI